MNTDGHGWEPERRHELHGFSLILTAGNEGLTESLRDRIMGKATFENLRGLWKLSWIVVRMNTNLNNKGAKRQSRIPKGFRPPVQGCGGLRGVTLAKGHKKKLALPAR